jgi:hypothetical protein
MRKNITIALFILSGCNDETLVDPIVTMYPFLIDSTPCKGSILLPAENVAIQQGETKGPYDSDSFIHACFIVTTTGPSTISITTTPATESSIRFVDPAYWSYKSAFVVDPSVSLPMAVTGVAIQVSSTNRYNFTISVK